MNLPHYLKKVVALIIAGHVGPAAKTFFIGSHKMLQTSTCLAKLPSFFPQGMHAPQPPTFTPTFFSAESILKILQKSRGSKSPGPSGWTEELLFDCCSTHPGNRAALKGIINDILSGNLGDFSLSAARLIAIPKGNDNLRPICISECVIKLAASVSLSVCTEHLNKILIRQFGLWECGAEFVVHSTRRKYTSQTAERPLFTVTIDARNAFNVCVSCRNGKHLYSQPALCSMWNIFFYNYDGHRTTFHRRRFSACGSFAQRR